MPGQGSRNSVMAIVSILVIVAATAFLFWYFKGRGDNPAAARDLSVVTIDIKTNKMYLAVQKKGESFPLEHPKTGERTLWAAYVCRDEKILFPVQPGTMTTTCPSCASNMVGGATKEHRNYRVVMPEE